MCTTSRPCHYSSLEKLIFVLQQNCNVKIKRAWGRGGSQKEAEKEEEEGGGGRGRGGEEEKNDLAKEGFYSSKTGHARQRHCSDSFSLRQLHVTSSNRERYNKR